MRSTLALVFRRLAGFARSCSRGLPLVALVAAAVVLAAVPLPVAAHVNHVSADPQVSPDGTLVAETAFIAADGYLAVHRDDDGDVGEAVGHVPLTAAGGLKTDVAVAVDPDVWADWTTGKLWLVLHTSDGDGQFEPESDDAVLETFGQPAGTRITVEKGDRALATAETFAPQRLNDSHTSVRIRNATLASDGAVVVRAADGGQVLGLTELSAGRHTNVSVALDESFLESNERFGAKAMLVSGGEPVTAGDAPVATVFGVRYRDEESTPTPALVRTATPTAESAGGAGDETDGGSGASGETAAGASNDDATAGGPDDDGGGTTGVAGPGFGLLAALLALAALALVARRGL